MSTHAVATPPATRGPLLRVALTLDAVVTGTNGAAYLLLAGPLGDLLGLEAGLLRGAGAVLLVFAAFVWAVSRRSSPARGAVLAVVVVNAVWALDSLVVAVAVAGWGTPSTAGTVWIVAQAVVVAAFAGLQLAGRQALR
jgi:hypothetical protein